MTGDRPAVRPARGGDRDFVLATARRLGEFGPPPWRTADEIVAGEVRTLEAHFEAPRGDNALLVAESAEGAPLGFAFLETPTDYFSLRPHAHIGILAVARDAEGQGAGRALLAAAEQWALSLGLHLLTLNVFDANSRARAVYEKAGYAPETRRYVKTL